MKKFLAILLVIATILSLCSPLAGCSAPLKAMQMGVWLDLVVSSFGMTEYTTKEALFEKVSPEDTYFGAFQIAAEWDVLTPDNNTSSSTEVTWRDVLLTLVNAGYFLDEDATDEEKIDYAIANFDPEIRKYWMDRTISMSAAVPLLDKAVDLWVNGVIENNVEEIKYKNDVTDLSEVALDYETDGNVVVLDAAIAGDLQPGDIYSLPSVDGKAEASLNKVSSIVRDGDKIIITNDPTFEGEEVAQYVESIDIEKNVPVDFSYITGIYDANGNPLYTADTGVNTALASITDSEYDNVKVTTLENSANNTVNAANLGFFDIKDKLEFSVGDFSIELEFEKNDFKLTLSKSDTKESAKRTQSSTTFLEVGIKDLGLQKKIKYSGVTLDSAYAKLNYTQTISGGIKYEKSATVGKYVEEGKNTKSELSTIINEYAKALGDLEKDVYNKKNETKSIYLCRIALGASGIDFIVKGKISATGELKITLTMQGTKGIEYRNGKLRYISSSTPSVDFVAEGKFEITIGPGFELNLLKIVKLTATMDAGLGAKIKYTAHLFDDESHQLFTTTASMSMEDAEALESSTYSTAAEDILAIAEASGATWKNYEPKATVTLFKRVCVEWSLYPVLKITGEIDVDFGTLFGKEIGFSKESSWTISGSDNKYVILKGHIEFPNNISNALDADNVFGGAAALLGVGAECTYENKPWDLPEEETTASTDETTETTEHQPILTGDAIELSASRIFMTQGQKETLDITCIPEGYTISDLKVTSDDSDIATVSISGNSILIESQDESGTVQVVVSTKDDAYSAFFAITVEEDEISFIGLGGLVA